MFSITFCLSFYRTYVLMLCLSPWACPAPSTGLGHPPPLRGAPYPALPPPPLSPGAGGPLRAAPGGPPLREREVVGVFHRADGEGSGGVVGPLKTGPLPTFWADGAGPIGRPPDPSGGGAPCPLGQRFGPPLRGALLQHLPPLAQFCQGDGPQLWPLTAPPDPDFREGTPGPLTVSGGQPTAYRALPRGRYPWAVCTAPGGHGSAPGGLAMKRQNPMLIRTA